MNGAIAGADGRGGLESDHLRPIIRTAIEAWDDVGGAGNGTHCTDKSPDLAGIRFEAGEGSIILVPPPFRGRRAYFQPARALKLLSARVNCLPLNRQNKNKSVRWTTRRNFRAAR
jgi:hypothetical protein